MKSLIIILFLGLSFFGFAQDQESAEKEALTGSKIFFDEDQFDFGDIQTGDVVEHVFSFENTGMEPLIISDVRTTCGCTVPEWPREAVMPGEKSDIKVVFNSTGKSGVQHKVITLMSNAVNNPTRIKIITNVLRSE